MIELNLNSLLPVPKSYLIYDNCINALDNLPCKVQTVITSPPYYGLRDYGVDCQIGLEKTPQEYIDKLVAIFHKVRNILADDGTLWLNLGDCYSGSGKGSAAHPEYAIGTKQGTNKGLPGQTKVNDVTFNVPHKNLVGIPWRVAFALQNDGWILRQDIIWSKVNPMPESVTDRCTKSHEYIFLFAKKPHYYFDNEAIKENCNTHDNIIRDREKGKLNSVPGRTHENGLKTNNYIKRNKRDVWTITSHPYKGAHFATFPEELITPCVLAGSKDGDYVLDPFNGSGTTGVVACKHGRGYIGIDCNPEYIEMSRKRIESI